MIDLNAIELPAEFITRCGDIVTVIRKEAGDTNLYYGKIDSEEYRIAFWTREGYYAALALLLHGKVIPDKFDLISACVVTLPDPAIPRYQAEL